MAGLSFTFKERFFQVSVGGFFFRNMNGARQESLWRAALPARVLLIAHRKQKWRQLKGVQRSVEKT